MEPLIQIAQAFKKDFAHWGLELPLELLESRQAAFIHSEGWLIQYKFGRDKRGENLDYYACHRMTSDGMCASMRAGAARIWQPLPIFLSRVLTLLKINAARVLTITGIEGWPGNWLPKVLINSPSI
jgi:hypothetical protein